MYIIRYMYKGINMQHRCFQLIIIIMVMPIMLIKIMTILFNIIIVMLIMLIMLMIISNNGIGRLALLK